MTKRMRGARQIYYESPLMTVKECAAFLKIHPSGMYRMIRKHKVPCFKIGSDWRFSKAEVVKWMEKLSAEEKARNYPPR